MRLWSPKNVEKKIMYENIIIQILCRKMITKILI